MSFQNVFNLYFLILNSIFNFMKNLLYSLLVVFTLVSCSKDDPTPAANVEGKWNLSTAKVELKSLFGDDDNTMDYKNQGVYLEFKSNNKFSGNIVLADDLAEMIEAGHVYESEYEQKGNELTLKIYDDFYEEYIPVKLQIQSVTGSEMVLKFTKAELTDLMKEYDKLDGTNENSQVLAFITSLNAVLTFSK